MHPPVSAILGYSWFFLALVREVLKLKTPPASEDTNGVFHALTSLEVAALDEIKLAAAVSFRLM
jgi:hypothetical protein